MENEKKQILLTNDDGILSPGLWAAASVLADLGFVTVVAPREQYSGAGRGFPRESDGIIETKCVQVNGQNWVVHAVGGSPAQTVLHGVLEVMPESPDLVVSGINFGENIGTGITASGTVGAALEAASLGIPALAASLETPIEHHFSLSEEVDFSAAAHFLKIFAGIMLNRRMPEDVDVLKLDVPFQATFNTPWEITKISRLRVFEAIPPQRKEWNEPGKVGYTFKSDIESAEPGSDTHTLKIRKVISLTPLSLDMTSRIDLKKFKEDLESA